MFRHLKQLPDWQFNLLLFIYGGLLGWVHAPYNFWWASFLCLPVLFVGLSFARSTRQAFWRGWLFAFGYFVLGLYWVAHALFVDIAQFWWALPLAVVALPVGLALFWGAAAALTFRFSSPQHFLRLLFFAGALALAEWLRGHVFTGFPWLLTAYLWIDVPTVRALAATLGAYGLTLWTLLIALLPAMFVLESSKRQRADTLALAVILMFMPLLNVPAELQSKGQVSLRLVQPNIEQQLKLDPAARAGIVARLLEQTGTEGHPQVVIWPETAVPFLLAQRPDVREQIAAGLPRGSYLVTGSPRREDDRFYNSVVVMDDQGQLLASYDKSHLVPFGEYIPFRQWLPFDPVAGGLDFSRGAGPRTLDIASLPGFGPLICYEVLFPGRIADPQHPPLWLLNVTNDGWYGTTHGPYQHLEITRMRAVEEGVPLVRVANTGISAVINADGDLAVAAPLAAAKTIDYQLELNSRVTFYQKWGDTPVLIAAILLVLAGLLPHYLKH